MKVSNKVKRNISMTLSIVGLQCVIARVWGVIMAPTSGRAWFELFGMVVLTYLCYDNFLDYRSRVRKGILFGRN